ncbi:MAG TPA: hypothetical protein DE042_00825 [Colwellia sp.]|nr:hypothetical protein [Colwellia sp.]
MIDILTPECCHLRLRINEKYKNITAEKDHCFGLLGSNDVGKKTMIEVIVGIIYLTAGQVIYKGKDYQGKNC